MDASGLWMAARARILTARIADADQGSADQGSVRWMRWMRIEGSDRRIRWRRIEGSDGWMRWMRNQGSDRRMRLGGSVDAHPRIGSAVAARWKRRPGRGDWIGGGSRSPPERMTDSAEGRDPPSERMNSPLEIREVRLRGLPRHGPSRCTEAPLEPCSCRASARDGACRCPSGGFTRSGRMPARDPSTRPSHFRTFALSHFRTFALLARSHCPS